MTTERTPVERPMLFSGPMVRALLTGRKTQTRRIVKAKNMIVLGDDGVWYDADCINPGKPLLCPYGKAGDLLWVRETWANLALPGYDPVYVFCSEVSKPEIWEGMKWKPSIHMPRAASRITLEITDVRVERLQDISEEDAIEEGVETIHVEQAPSPANDFEGGHFLGMKDYENPGEFAGFGGDAGYCNSAKQSYRTLWESINGPGSWGSNPFVWVVTFNRIKP